MVKSPEQDKSGLWVQISHEQDNTSGVGSYTRYLCAPEDHFGSQVLQGTPQAISLPESLFVAGVSLSNQAVTGPSPS